MELFEPMINVLVLMTVLSVVAERLTNWLKMNRPTLRVREASEEAERERESGITNWALLMGVLVALLMKADAFAILSQLEDPWKTIGWVRVENYRWMRSPATVSFAGVAYSIGGCLITGVGLGFGSKFWHDVLGAVYDTRNRIRQQSDLARTVPAKGTVEPEGGPGDDKGGTDVV